MLASRASRGLPLLVLAALLLFSFPSASAVSHFSEDFNAFPNGWTVHQAAWSPYPPGVYHNCGTGVPACSIELNPPIWNSAAAMEKGVNVPLTATTTVTFHFMSSNTWANTDAGFHVRLNDGTSIVYSPSEGINNGVSISTSGGFHAFGSWGVAGRWYRATIIIDPIADTVRGQLWDGGSLVAESNPLGIAATVDAIPSLYFSTIHWSTNSNSPPNVPFYWDAIRIEDNAPAAPSNVQATGDIRAASVSWTAPGNTGPHPLSTYKVYQSTSSSGPWTHVATTTHPTTSTTVGGLANGATYWFAVSAVTAGGEGARSAADDATTAPLPGAPTVTATPGDTSVALSWTAGSTGGYGILDYKVHRSTTSGFTPDASNLVRTTTSTSWTDTGRTNGVDYYYRVIQRTAVGDSPPSDQRDARPYGLPGVPDPTATPGNASVALSWSAPNDNGRPITSYRVYSSTTSGFTPGPSNFVADTGTATSYTHQGVANGVTRHYRVTATNLAGEGGASTQDSAVPYGTPFTPLPSRTEGDTSITLSWPAVGDNGRAVTNYRVHRGSDASFVPSSANKIADKGTSLTHTDTGLTNGQTYWYRVVAENLAGASDASVAVGGTPYGVPGAPRNLAGTGEARAVSLTWDAPLSDNGRPVTSYRVYRGNAACTANAADEGTTTSRSFTVTGLADNTTYCFRVAAINLRGEGAPGGWTSVTTDALPAAPSLAPATLSVQNGNIRVHLTWTPPAYNGGSPLTGFGVYRGDPPGTETRIGAAATSSHVDANRARNREYSYEVTAENLVGEGPHSNRVTILTPDVPTAPGTLTVTAFPTRNELDWSVPSSDGRWAIKGYVVYRGYDAGGSKTNISFVPATATEFTDTTAEAGRTAYYEVSAVNEVGEGPRTNEAGGAVGSPNPPTDLRCAPGDNRMDLTWTASAGADALTRYHVYRNSTDVLTPSSGTTTTSWTDATAANGVTYTYRVRASNTVGFGAYSNEVVCRPPPVAGSPQAATAEWKRGREVEVKWSPPTENPTVVRGYSVYRQMGTDPVARVADNLTTLTFLDQVSEKGKRYRYYVTAWNGFEEGPSSNVPDTVVPNVPNAPTLAGAPGNHSASLTWSVPTVPPGGTSVQAYVVYRGDSCEQQSKLATEPTQTQHTDQPLVNGQYYCYRVAAKSSMGEGDLSNHVIVRPRGTPGAPLPMTSGSGNGWAHLDWSTPTSDGGANITAYRVYRDNVLRHETTPAVTLFHDTQVTNNQTYTYTVVAVNEAGEGAAAVAVLRPAPVPPSAPRNLVGVPGNRTASLSWDAPADDGGLPIMGYRVFRGLSCNTKTELATTGPDQRTIQNGGLTNGTTYCYHVVAFNGMGDGNASQNVLVKPRARPDPPVLSASPFDRRVILAWSEPENGGEAITGYRIFRNGSWLVDTGTNRSWTDAGRVNGVAYSYQVTAVNAAGESERSNTAVATPRTTPGVPRNTALEPHQSHIVVTWTSPTTDGGAAVTHYAVYRALGEGKPTHLGNSSTTTFDDATVVLGQEYCYSVRAVNAAGEGSPSSQECAVATAAPSEPRDVEAQRSGDRRSAVVAWNASKYRGDGQVYEYCAYVGFTEGVPAQPPTCRFLYELQPGLDRQMSVTVSGLDPMLSYRMWVTARNDHPTPPNPFTESAPSASKAI